MTHPLWSVQGRDKGLEASQAGVIDSCQSTGWGLGTYKDGGAFVKTGNERETGLRVKMLEGSFR